VHSRLSALGLNTVRLPMNAAPNEAHVPILVSSNMATASRVIVIFGETTQDLGVWAYRTIGAQSIDEGSVVPLARAILRCHNNDGASEDIAIESRDRKDTALVLANTGQLIWHCGSAKAMTMPTWLACPRKSAVDSPLRMTYRNKIPCNENWQEHIKYVFEEVLAARGRLLRDDAKISIIGLAEGGSGALRYLASHCKLFHRVVYRLSLTFPYPAVLEILFYPVVDLSFPYQGRTGAAILTLSASPIHFIT
jgi:hypothetical protein